MDQIFHANFWTSAALLWVFAAVIHGMPAPSVGSFWYRWLYNTFQFMGANLDRIGDSKPAPLVKLTDAEGNPKPQ